MDTQTQTPGQGPSGTDHAHITISLIYKQMHGFSTHHRQALSIHKTLAIHYKRQYLWTAWYHLPSSDNIASSEADVPTNFSASLVSCGAHSCLGRPSFRTNLSVTGCSVPGMKVIFRKTSLSGARATLPYKRSCCFNKCEENCFWFDRCSTVLLEILDTNEGAMRRTFRRQRA